MVIYKRIRYGNEIESKKDTLEQAMSIAFKDWEENRASPTEIIDKDKVYDYDDIKEYWDKKGWLDLD